MIESIGNNIQINWLQSRNNNKNNFQTYRTVRVSLTVKNLTLKQNISETRMIWRFKSDSRVIKNNYKWIQNDSQVFQNSFKTIQNCYKTIQKYCKTIQWWFKTIQKWFKAIQKWLKTIQMCFSTIQKKIVNNGSWHFRSLSSELRI